MTGDRKKFPRYIGCISTAKGLPLIVAPQPAADYVELRFDTLYAANRDAAGAVIPFLKKRRNRVILTIRAKAEGGSVAWKTGERGRLFNQLLPFVDAVDFELASLRSLRDCVATARRLGKEIIISAHAINQSISRRRGVQLVRELRRHRCAYYKIAGLARTGADLNVLVRLLIDNHRSRLAVMGIGPGAALSRRVLPLLGSALVYGYLDIPAAKNQPSLKEVRKALTVF